MKEFQTGWKDNQKKGQLESIFGSDGFCDMLGSFDKEDQDFKDQAIEHLKHN